MKKNEKKYNWDGLFRVKGYRWTMSRQSKIEAINKEQGHLSAEEIYYKVRKKYPSIGLATVYRTLEILAQMGIITKLDFGDNRFRYELAEKFSDKGHHHHLVCKKCNKIIEYDDFVDDEIVLIQKVENALSKKYGFKIDDHNIQFYGLCQKCKKI